MDAITRRSEILRTLENSEESISASQFADRFGVTRQIIVSDIALLRANSHRVVSSRYGYRMERETPGGRLETVVCRHGSGQVLDEFYAVVDHGGSVLSVLVEHPIYGELSAQLNIHSRYDAQEFVRRMSTTNAAQLSDLTGGLHIHTLRLPDEQAYFRVLSELRRLGILVEGEQ